MALEYQVTVHKCDNYTVRIHKPILTADEKEARENNVKNTIVQFYKERMKVSVHS